MGFGLSAAGLSPFGYGTPAGSGEVPTVGSGRAGVRYINPASGDYEQDSDTLQLKQMPELRQRVLLKLRTLKGSSAVLPDYGIELPDKLTAGYQLKVADSVRVAFKQETDVEKIMRLDGVIVEQVLPGRIEVTVSYTDLEREETDRVTV